MNINDLTIGQGKELVAMFGGITAAPAPHPFVGKYCICRCTGAGVHAGTVVSVDGDTAVLCDSRRLWSWTTRAGVALSGVAQNGLAGGKIDTANPEIYLTGVCEIIPCSAKAREDIQNA
jgi:hypothetical protein